MVVKTAKAGIAAVFEEEDPEDVCPPGFFDKVANPGLQRYLWSSIRPYQWQSAIWEGLWQPGAQVAVRTCNESGKSSYVVPILALTWAASFPASQVVITSASEEQVNLQLWPAIRGMVRRQPKWRHTKDRIYGPSVRGLEPSVIAIRVTKQGERFEGFHNRLWDDDQGRQVFSPLLIIADEAKSIKRDIFEAIERCNPMCELRISTTGEDSGDFYEACQNLTGDWITELGDIEFKIPWTMCPHLLKGHTRRRKMNLLRTRGEADPFVMSNLLAEFFTAGAKRIFDSHDLGNIQHAMGGLVSQFGTERTGACDFAAGGDECTFAVRDGNMVKEMIGWHSGRNDPPSMVAGQYCERFAKWNLRPENIWCDNGGIGQLIINEIEKADNGRWLGINRYIANDPPRDKSLYVNQYAEDHFALRLYFHERAISIPKDSTLYEQMRLRRYTMRNYDNNQIRMEPKDDPDRKKRGEPSPDRLDTLIMLMKDMAPAGLVKPRRGPMRTPSPEDCFKEAEEERTGAFGGGYWGDNY